MEVRQRGDYCILYPGSDLGVVNIAEKLYENLGLLRDKGHCRICVDLNNAPIIDSSVIGTLVRFHEDLRKNEGELIIISEPNRAVEAMLHMHLGKVIRFVQSEKDLF